MNLSQKIAKSLFVVFCVCAICLIDLDAIAKAVAKNNKENLYQVVRVIDGDTIEVEIGSKKEKIRLIGIDTPETVHPSKSLECFGKEASGEAKTLMLNKKIKLEGDSIGSNRDKYQRLLRYVYLQDGTFVNAYMVQHGYAYTYTVFPFKYLAVFKQYQNEAMNKSFGLWNIDVCPGQNKKPNVKKRDGGSGQCSIKGNINARGEKIYHIPVGNFYDKTVIDESNGEKWFCTEKDARIAGWRRSLK